jgi:hypothetical protein
VQDQVELEELEEVELEEVHQDKQVPQEQLIQEEVEVGMVIFQPMQEVMVDQV